MMQSTSAFQFFCVLVFLCLPACSWSDLGYYPPEKITLKPVPAQAHFYKGIIEEDKENWLEAAVHFDLASRIDPESSRIYLHLGKSLVKLEKYRRGIEFLRKAEIYARFDDYLLWFELGESYQLVGLYSPAKFCYKRAINIFPKFQKAQQALAELKEV